jgi:hypothetical protein
MPPRQRPNATHATTRVSNQTAASPGCSIATRTQPHTATADTSRSFATAVFDASGGNSVLTREAGGWASARTVEEIYAHADVHDPVFDRALRKAWGDQE